MEKKRQVNIGHLFKSQLKKKLDSLPESKFIKRNINGKVGINKANDYKHLPDAPRKRCHKCGNQNHLDIDCKLNSPKAQSPKASESKNSKPLNVLYKPEKPCYHCGSKFHSIYIYVYIYIYIYMKNIMHCTMITISLRAIFPT